jgi:hypothetical protein
MNNWTSFHLEHFQAHCKNSVSLSIEIRLALKSPWYRVSLSVPFHQWFKVLHNDTISEIIINSFLTDSFPVDCRVRQGCPWAPFLFLCAVEPLGVSLRQSKMQGIVLPDGRRVVYSGYADDTTLYLNGLDDLNKAVKIFSEYLTVSGMKLNMSKSLIVPMGTLIDHRPLRTCKFKWLTEVLNWKLLRVPIGLIFSDDHIWKDLLQILSESIKHWACQKLSVYGRVHAARSYIGGKPWFLATMVSPSSKGLNCLSAMLWAYVQNNNILDLSVESNSHYSAWPRMTLVQSISEGGLNTQHFEFQMTAIHTK